MTDRTSKQNPVVERARAARERTGHWPGSHAEALCNEVVRLHALVLEREGMLGRAASEISDLQQSARETTANPVAWMKGHRSYRPGEPDDYDVECYAGD